MGYTESLLADGEKIALRERQHWLAPTVRGRWSLLLILVGIVAFVLSLSVTGGLNTLLVYGAIALIVVGLVWFASFVVRWRAEAYLVTNRRVIKITGVLNKHAADSSLEMINDAVLDQSVLGRILGYGDLGILTGAKTDGDRTPAASQNRAGADGEIDHFRMLHHAVAFKVAMLNEKQQLEFEGMRPVAMPGGR